MLISLVVVLLVVDVDAVSNITVNVVQAQTLYSLLDEVELEVLEVLVDVVEAKTELIIMLKI
jgi:hypothetical protein